MTATDALANRPIVQCAEGHKLAALLKPLPRRAAPKLTIAAPAETLEFEADGIEMDSPAELAANEFSMIEEPMVFDVSQESEQHSVPAVAYWPAGVDSQSPAESRASTYANFRLVADATPSPKQADTTHDEQYSEPDLIVIEEESPAVHQVKVVRRGQYRRLFSSMRRG